MSVEATGPGAAVATPYRTEAAPRPGRVPLFYYLLHVAILHSLAVAASAARFHAVHWMFESPTLDRFPVTQPPGWPMSLPAVYALRALVVALAYPCCRWFAALKARRTDRWLSYL